MYSDRGISSVDISLTMRREPDEAIVSATIKFVLTGPNPGGTGPEVTIALAFPCPGDRAIETAEAETLDRARAVLERICAEPADTLRNQVGRWD